jgi:hypothetical protein
MVSEDEYTGSLIETLDAIEAIDTIEREVYHESSGRWLDILVIINNIRFAVEVENTAEDALYNGVGQAIFYADQFNAIPVVVYPQRDDQTVEIEIQQQWSQCPIIPIPKNWDGSLDQLSA